MTVFYNEINLSEATSKINVVQTIFTLSHTITFRCQISLPLGESPFKKKMKWGKKKFDKNNGGYTFVKLI